MEVSHARPLRNKEARDEEGRQENARRHDGEDEEEKGDEEKALMKNTKSGRAQARRVKKHLKSSAMSRAKKARTARSINQPPKKKAKS